jgi:hypothetical protein
MVQVRGQPGLPLCKPARLGPPGLGVLIPWASGWTDSGTTGLVRFGEGLFLRMVRTMPATAVQSRTSIEAKNP